MVFALRHPHPSTGLYIGVMPLDLQPRHAAEGSWLTTFVLVVFAYRWFRTFRAPLDLQRGRGTNIVDKNTTWADTSVLAVRIGHNLGGRGSLAPLAKVLFSYTV